MANRLHPRVKRTRADIQQCKDCKGNASMPNPARPTRLMDCPTCNGQGIIPHRAPYRLSDGTWSDGIDRHIEIHDRIPPQNRWQVCKLESGYWEAYAESDGQQLDEIDAFDTHAEAIRYADRHARTTKSGDAP